MNIAAVEFLSWHKSRPKARYDLAASGVPKAPVAELIGDAEAFQAEMDCCAPNGHPKLIEAIARRYGVGEQRVLPTPGASMANFVAAACVADRVQKVLLETPVYEPLRRVVELSGVQVVWVPRRADARGFPGLPDVNAIEQGLREGAVAVMLSNHHNPGGIRFGRDEAAAIAGLCDKHGAYLIVDEVYLDFARLNLGEPLWTAASLNDRVVATGSLSKVYGLGPLRAGWLIADARIAARARNLIDHLHVVDSAPGQVLALRAFQQIERFEERTRAYYRAGRRMLDDWLAARADVSSNRDDGVVFALLEAQGVADTDRLADLLLRQFDTLVVPGRFFGCRRFVRVGFGDSPDDLREALDRIGRAIDTVRTQSY